MERRALRPRDNWQEVAAEHGFTFHTPDGERYWDETHAYRFTLREIEEDLEDPAEELEQMCFEVVERAVADEQVLRRLAIPETFWGYVVESWRNRERNLYGRMDFRYDGNGPAKLYEYNADTPTALYESAIFQWVWLEQAMEQGLIPEGSDQFNSLHERLIDALSHFGIDGPLHLACARDTDEDLGTVEYLEDCARQAGLGTRRMFIEDIGLAEDGRFTDLDDEPVGWLFKLYPWEWLMEEEFGSRIPGSGTHFIEPGWKAVLSNKGLLAFLWEMFEGHPNLLPTFFDEDPKAASLSAGYVRKPLLSREGANIAFVENGRTVMGFEGPYGAEGFVRQALAPLPSFEGRRPMCGVWLVASEPAGMCIREDEGAVTTDDACFVPHFILD